VSVYLVSDVQSNRKMLSLLLAQHGISSDMTENGEKAVELLKLKPGTYDLIFMDNMMPVMVSFTVIAMARNSTYDAILHRAVR